ncbi:MAG: hypothetical protein QXI33_00595 [Candidatus Pacearchaeota archaeon]
MDLFRNKKGVDLLHSTIIFLILNLMFFGIMFGVVYKAGTNAAFYEQLYSKQIALLIDSSKPGTTLSINLNHIEEILESENISPNEIFDFQNGKVTVKLTRGTKGYSFFYFSNYNVEKSLERGGNGDLFLKLIISEKSKNG